MLNYHNKENVIQHPSSDKSVSVWHIQICSSHNIFVVDYILLYNSLIKLHNTLLKH